MSYPKEVVLRRIRNELGFCRKYIGSDFAVDDITDLPCTIDMEMHNVYAYETEGKVIADHRFSVTFTEDYGQSKPEVRWRSHIFHPNILDPDDGGIVCTRMLNEWTYGMKLVDFIAALEFLITNPVVSNPFGTDSCLRAAEFYRNYPMKKTTFSAVIRD